MNHMTNLGKKPGGVAALCIGSAFSIHLIRFWWLELRIGPVAGQNFFAVEDVMRIINSPLWAVSGVMHLVAAAALLTLALPESKQAAENCLRRYPGAIAAVIGSGCFLLVGMTHLIGVSQIGSLTASCAGDGHTALVTYNLVRTVVLGSSFIALGCFLLLDAGSKLRAGIGPKSIHIIGLLAGVLCVLFVFLYTIAPLFLTTLMMVAVAAWGFAKGSAMLAAGFESDT